MPACWYVLLRYWLRVDDVIVRCALALSRQAIAPPS
jgi:hypothetical protein